MSSCNNSSDESSFHEEDWLLDFESNDNPQTWLYCQPGDDPNLVLDLEHFLSTKCRTEAETPTPPQSTAPTVDSRTFIRKSKKNKRSIWTERLEEDLKAAQARRLPITPPNNQKEDNKENINTSSADDTANLRSRTHLKTRQSDEVVLLENVSYPTSFYSELSGSELPSSDPSIEELLPINIDDLSVKSENILEQLCGIEGNPSAPISSTFSHQLNVTFEKPPNSEEPEPPLECSTEDTSSDLTINLIKARYHFKPRLESTPIKHSKRKSRSLSSLQGHDNSQRDYANTTYTFEEGEEQSIGITSPPAANLGQQECPKPRILRKAQKLEDLRAQFAHNKGSLKKAKSMSHELSFYSATSVLSQGQQFPPINIDTIQEVAPRSHIPVTERCGVPTTSNTETHVAQAMDEPRPGCSGVAPQNKAKAKSRIPQLKPKTKKTD